MIISLIAFYAVLSGTENKRILQVKNEIYTFEMTEEEAAKAVFDYIYSDCDYDYDAKVISTMCQGEMVYLYQTQEKSDLQYEMLQSKDRTEDGQYYVFAHDTRYETDALSQGFYDESVEVITGIINGGQSKLQDRKDAYAYFSEVIQ